MKKYSKILTIASVIAVSSTTASYSYAETLQLPNIKSEQVMPEKSIVEESDFINFSGKVTNITKNKKSVSITVDHAASGEKMVFVLTEQVSLYDTNTGKSFAISDIKKGDGVKGYYHKDTIMPMIYPAQVEPDFLLINDSGEKPLSEVKVSKFNPDFISKDKQLKLNISKETELVNERGQKLEKEDLLGKELIVFYTMTTRSIPAQTTPSKIIAIENRTIMNEKYNYS